jgi:uncharacterized repeat protein (TIGR02543 family)
MSRNFNKIKSEAELIHRIINDRYRASNTLDKNAEIIELTTAFSRIVEARNTSFDSFDKLFKKRLEVYDTMFSSFYMSYFSNILFVNAGFISNLFKLLDIAGTQEFFDNFLEAIYLKENNPTSQRLLGLSDYFSIKFSELSLEIYPESIVEFKLNDERGLYVDNVLISQSQKEEDKVFEMLYFLGALSNIKDNDFIDEISNYYEYLSDNETNFNKVIKDRIFYRLTIIDSAIKSNKYLDAYREEKDSVYKKTYIQDILALFDELSEVTVNFSDLSPENITLTKQSGIYEKLFSLVVDIDGKINSLISNTLESIKVIEEILENYSIFVRIPSIENSSLLDSIKAAEDSYKDFDKYANVIETKIFFNPFSKILTLTDWVKDITKDKNLNGNINILMLLYIGANLKEFSSADLSKSISEYAFVNLARKRLIVDEYLSDSFKAIKIKEQELISVNKIRVKERPQDDLIGFAYKSILPTLEILDYISFEEVFIKTAPIQPSEESEPPFESPRETSFRLQIKLLIIEAILKDRKNINGNIMKLIDSVSDMPKENLKTLYLEICFREAIESFVSYLEPLAEVSNFSNSIINQDAYNKMRDYVYDPSNVIYNQIKSVVVKYIEVWEFFYSVDIDLVDKGLKQFVNEEEKNYIRNLAIGVIYVVSFNSQGGSLVSSINAPIKSLITAPAAPTKSGFTFTGWYKESETTNIWDFSTDRVYSNTTLYAKWVE